MQSSGKTKVFKSDLDLENEDLDLENERVDPSSNSDHNDDAEHAPVVPEKLITEQREREGSERPYGDEYLVPIFGETDDMVQRFRHEHGRLGIEAPSDPDEPWSDYSSMGGRTSSDEDMDDQ